MIRRTKAFVVSLSDREEIKIDQEELKKVESALESGNFVKVKQGIINPSFVVNITLDQRRIQDWIDMCGHGFGYEGINESGIPALDNKTGVKEITLLEAQNLGLETYQGNEMTKGLAEKMRLN